MHSSAVCGMGSIPPITAQSWAQEFNERTSAPKYLLNCKTSALRIPSHASFPLALPFFQPYNFRIFLNWSITGCFGLYGNRENSGRRKNLSMYEFGSNLGSARYLRTEPSVAGWAGKVLWEIRIYSCSLGRLENTWTAVPLLLYSIKSMMLICFSRAA